MLAPHTVRMEATARSSAECPAVGPADNSYGRILNSSLLIGGSSLVTVLAAILRTKFVAVFLGPAGIGLMGLLGAITNMVGTVTVMGIGTSGVREIAEAAGAGDARRTARAVTALKRVVFRLGFVGAVLVAVFSVPLSHLTFGTAEHAGEIALLSLVVAAGAVTEGHVTVLRGFRRMRDLARVAILGTTLSLALAVPTVYFLRQDAVVPLLLVASGAGLASAWWYARRIEPVPVSLTWRETLKEAQPLMRLGLASMSAALMAAAIAYVIRVVIVRDLSFEAAGMYQSATALSSVYCGFILSAMGADFLPRLSSVASDDQACNRLVNEQAEVGLLLAFPGICATLAFSPLILQLLYSAEFGPASDVLRWQVLGVFLRVASWPMGYLLLAKQRATLYFWTELSYNLVHLGLLWIGIRFAGLAGTGIAFFGLYIYYTLLMYLVTRSLSGFAWSLPNKRLARVAIPTVAFVFACPAILPSPWQVIAAGAATALVCVYSFRTLLSLSAHREFQETVAGQIQLLRAAGLKVADAFKVRHG